MRTLFLTLLLFSASLSSAHEIRPAYIQIQQINEEEYTVYWKIPSRDKAFPKLRVVFSGTSSIEQKTPPNFIDGFAIFSYKIQFNKSIKGQRILIDGLSKTLIDVLVRIEYRNGEQNTFLLQADNDSEIISGETSTWEVVKTYGILGIEHILFGFDHLLFVLALMVIAKGKLKIIKTITAFTIAHSITLVLASLGIVHIPVAPVEAVISLSVVFLAFEILNNVKGRQTLTSQKPWFVASSFGLLHGFGFASALTDIGIPQQDLFYALAFFNIGVEVGQLVFIFSLMILAFFLVKSNLHLVSLKKIAAYGIGSIATFWTLEKLFSF